MKEFEIQRIVSEMTLEEKASLCSGKDNWYTKGIDRLGVPSVMLSDGPHGLRTQRRETDHLGLNGSIPAVCFPAACATAASFSRETAERLGSALGDECLSEQVAVLLGPAINIKRSPLCGRNFEYLSEDPVLSGELAASYVSGVQSKGVGVSVKHFALNNQETRRMTVSAEVGSRAMREIYLAGFETVVRRAKPHTVMCSYNRINGVPASQNEELLNKILREEWGFEGYVMSDWGAVSDRVAALKAGLELEMPNSGGETDLEITEAVRAGSLEESVLDRAVKRILSVVFKESEALASAKADSVDWECHHRLAVETEQDCAVLLKNENNCLPILPGETAALIGEFAFRPRYQGGGSSHVNAFRVTCAADHLKGENVLTAQGYSEREPERNAELLAEAVKIAERADKAILFVGLPDSFESEGYDRKHMSLPDSHSELIRAVCNVNPRVAVVLHNGSPVEMHWIGSVQAVLELYLGGQGVGEAAANLLTGSANPSGRLPETFPVHLRDNPSHLNFPGDGDICRYGEGIFVGYRWYDAKQIPVLFPFGHGLSYTRFEYSNLRLSSDKFREGETLTVSVDVTNAGKVTGREVVQLYVSDRSGNVSRPVKELKAFDKISLNPGECKTVSFELGDRAFAYYDETSEKFCVPSGKFALLVCRSAAETALESFVEVAGKPAPLEVTRDTLMGDLAKHPGTKPFVDSFIARAMLKYGGGEKDEKKPAGTIITEDFLMAMVEGMPLRGLQNLLRYNRSQLDEMIAGLNAKRNGQEPEA